MKNIAILSYKIMFDPSEAWSSGYEFENSMADFFTAHGFEANIIEAKGGSNERVIWLTKIEQMPIIKEAPSQDIKAQVQKVQQQQAPKRFKQFVKTNQPNSNIPKLSYKQGSDLRTDIAKPQTLGFRKVKHG